MYSGTICPEQLQLMNVKLVVSYNYKYIIKRDVIEKVQGNIINLHISLLPWNRGSNPNFWSFMEETPKGVSIHYINEKLDKGKILLQKEVFFDEKIETFATTYETLNKEIVSLFLGHWKDIKKQNITPIEQAKVGTYHSLADFLSFIRGTNFNWNLNIYDYKQKIHYI